MKFLQINLEKEIDTDVTVIETVYVGYSSRGRNTGDRYVWRKLADGWDMAHVKIVNQIPQNAKRLDAPNRSGGRSYR